MINVKGHEEVSGRGVFARPDIPARRVRSGRVP